MPRPPRRLRPGALFAYDVDHKGLAAYTQHSPELRGLIKQRAELGLRVAQALAPRGTRPKPAGAQRLAASMTTQTRLVTDRYGNVRYGVAIRTRVPYGAVTETGRKAYAEYPGREFMQRMTRVMSTPRRRRRV
jgi:hypothetical protein